MNTKNTISNTSKYLVKSKPQFVETGQTVSKSKGACKYYISTLEVGGGSEGNTYFAYVVRGGGGSRGKMLILLCKGSKFLFT